ncbi:Hsp20/alpha crystallin family protein [Bacillus alveayuensis]|jgi:HSP20 family protein|uniref:HSP20 family protein n=1 Tax=Aeribacillus alveayuensis TaxID=279215 RepID=A0ABT9VQ13_9BACI|nr:Hsp20/alpha crystallin family protein [Bacillus alveayuensis]MDQ0162950.1 HSP20 family protein [Bacillus alveayuensis]
MALIPYEPFRQLDHFRREMNRMFTEGFPQLMDHFERATIPRMDVHETDQEVIVTCDLPGLEKKEDVQIDLDQNVLSISGTIHRKNEIKEEQMHQMERFTGRFHRSITLPANVKEDEVRATYKNGVLEIHIPKQSESTKRKIDVQFH